MNAIKMPAHIAGFLAANYPLGLFFANETFSRYRSGAWEQIEERAHVKHRLARYFGDEATATGIRDSLALLKDFLAVGDSGLNPHKHLICLRNGTLDTQTYQLLEHSSSHRITNRTDIEWSPKAPSPRWLQFLDEVFANDIDKDQKIGFMQEWFGYCLVPDTSQHKFVWMVGAGGNGKSVLLNVLTRLVGESNVCHAYMDRLNSPFVRAELDGKLLNVSSEMSAGATISDGYFKSIVSGDLIEAECKYKRPFSFRPIVRLIASTNHLPRLLDNSDGFNRRAVIMSFNRQFSEQEKDANLENKLVEELPGILAWSVEGLRRLRERGRFDIPESSITALAQYRQESDPVGLFAEECLEGVTEYGMRPSDLYQCYQTWCRGNGYSPMNSINLGKRLTTLGFSKRRSGGNDFWLVTNKQPDFIPGESIRLAEEVPPLVQGVVSPESQSTPSRYKL